MTAPGLRPLVPCIADGSAARACTDADGHESHAWTDGRRAWTCPGRTGTTGPAVLTLRLAG